MDALQFRFIVYRHFVHRGVAPSREDLAAVAGGLAEADRLLLELHERHMLVLDDRPGRRGEIRMALPFATEPTDFRVTTVRGSWWANCAWDSLAMIAALHSDGRVDATWSDTGEPLRLDVVDGELRDDGGLIHFALPAVQWWDDIVLT